MSYRTYNRNQRGHSDGNKIYLESEEVERVGAKILEPGD